MRKTNVTIKEEATNNTAYTFIDCEVPKDGVNKVLEDCSAVLANILSVQKPQIIRCPAVAFCNGLFHIAAGVENLPLSDDEFTDIPIDGFYDNSTHTIYVPEAVTARTTNNTIETVRLTLSDQIFILANKMQLCFADQYGLYPYDGVEYTWEDPVDKPAHIDADAFAMAFLFSDVSKVRPEDLNTDYMNFILDVCKDDGGERKERAKMFAEYYHFQNFKWPDGNWENTDKVCLVRPEENEQYWDKILSESVELSMPAE